MHPSVDTPEQNVPETEWVPRVSRMKLVLSQTHIGPFQLGSCIEPELTEAKRIVPFL